MQETPEEKEAHLKNIRERAKASRMQERLEEKEAHLKKAKAKRKTEIRQNLMRQKDSLKMSNNSLLLSLSINQLNSQVRKTGRSLNHR